MRPGVAFSTISLIPHQITVDCIKINLTKTRKSRRLRRQANLSMKGRLKGF